MAKIQRGVRVGMARNQKTGQFAVVIHLLQSGAAVVSANETVLTAIYLSGCGRSCL